MNLARLLSATARHHPDHVAVSWGSQERTYAELNGRVDRLVAAFGALGLQRGDRVGFLLWNRPELLEVAFACFRAGLCVVPLNARFNAEEVIYHLGDPRAAALVHGPEFADLVAEASDRLDSVRHVLHVGEPAPRVVGARLHEYEDALAAQPHADDRTIEVDADELCWLFYTSGTTGRPKGAMLTHGNLLFVAMGWVVDLMPLTPNDVTLHAAPLTHGAGFHALAAVAKGCRQVLAQEPSFDPDAILELMERERVTNTWMVPTQVHRLINAPSLPDRDLSALHSLLYGGAPMHVEDLTLAIERLGPVLVQIYGQGETPMTGTYLPQHEHVLGDPHAQRRLASAGYARTALDIGIVDEDDRPLPNGEMGEVVVRGPSVMTGYWERPEESAQALQGGWLHTGDIGRLDERGYLYLLDRKKDLIISGGANVYAREVEEVLLRHPGVDQAAVIGVPDREWGERVVAVVVVGRDQPSDSQAARALIDHCGGSLASYKKPKQVDFVDELPVSAYGKVLKRELRARYAG
ncbi:MAG: long-chain-fatty-acid--CoA ligase [Egibacteraceae bacterium]